MEKSTVKVNKVQGILVLMISSSMLVFSFYMANMMLKPAVLTDFYKFMSVIMFSFAVVEFVYFKFKKS